MVFILWLEIKTNEINSDERSKENSGNENCRGQKIGKLIIKDKG